MSRETRLKDAKKRLVVCANQKWRPKRMKDWQAVALIIAYSCGPNVVVGLWQVIETLSRYNDWGMVLAWAISAIPIFGPWLAAATPAYARSCRAVDAYYERVENFERSRRSERRESCA